MKRAVHVMIVLSMLVLACVLIGCKSDWYRRMVLTFSVSYPFGEPTNLPVMEIPDRTNQ
jgi:hypothetical protein